MMGDFGHEVTSETCPKIVLVFFFIPQPHIQVVGNKAAAAVPPRPTRRTNIQAEVAYRSSW